MKKGESMAGVSRLFSLFLFDLIYFISYFKKKVLAFLGRIYYNT